MRFHAPAILLGLLLAAPLAHAQLLPGAREGSSVLSRFDEMPTALGFETIRKTSTVSGRGHKLLHYHVRAAYPASGLKLREWSRTSHHFGGGYRLIGYAHETQTDKWRFVALSPKGERFSLCLEADAGGGTLLTVDTHADFGPEIRPRRAYQEDDPGPRP